VSNNVNDNPARQIAVADFTDDFVHRRNFSPRLCYNGSIHKMVSVANRLRGPLILAFSPREKETNSPVGRGLG